MGKAQKINKKIIQNKHHSQQIHVKQQNTHKQTNNGNIIKQTS